VTAFTVDRFCSAISPDIREMKDTVLLSYFLKVSPKPIPNAVISRVLASHPTTLPSTTMPCDFVSFPATGSHLTGCRLKKGHGGTMRRKVMAFPPKPMYSASLMS
jgi:hypothetical protein